MFQSFYLITIVYYFVHRLCPFVSPDVFSDGGFPLRKNLFFWCQSVWPQTYNLTPWPLFERQAMVIAPPIQDVTASLII